MDKILTSPEETVLQALVLLSNEKSKEKFIHLGGNMGDLPDQIIPTIAADIMHHSNM